MSTILVAIDFSSPTRPLITVATRLARCWPASLCLVHVAPPKPEFVGYGPGPQVVRDQVATQLHGEHRQLQALETQLRADGLTVSSLLIQGPIAAKIVAESERLPADLIVIGSHGHGPLQQALSSSISQAVTRSAPCPVVVVPLRC